MLLTVAVLLLAASNSCTARPVRQLQQAGRPQAWSRNHRLTTADVSGAIPTNTVPGGDILVIDTTSSRLGDNQQGGSVLSNQLQDNARSGSTYDLLGTVTRTQAVGRADAELRSAIGSQDQQSFVQEAVETNRPKESAFATMEASGAATITSRGRGKNLRDPGNRANLASMDAQTAVQLASDGRDGDVDHATRAGTASASSVMVPTNYWYVYSPTWWRR